MKATAFPEIRVPAILMATVLTALTALTLSACSSKVIVNKESCKEIYGGTLMECEQVKK